MLLCEETAIEHYPGTLPESPPPADSAGKVQSIFGSHNAFAAEGGQPAAALISDLEQCGLLDQTLILWGGFVKGGLHHGEWDESGFKAAIDKVQRVRLARHDPHRGRTRS